MIILMKRYALAAAMFSIMWLQTAAAQDNKPAPFTTDDVRAAEKVIGLNFSPAERDSMMDDLLGNLENYQSLRKMNLPNSVAPALQFNPLPPGFEIPEEEKPVQWSSHMDVKVPDNPEDLAFYSVGQLASLIRDRKITSTQLTRMYLQRLKEYDPQLHCVITLTEEMALQQAAQADREIASGFYRGPLHGIPYGVKDLLAVAGTRTTWGATPYKEQVIDRTATVVDRLEEAGAVLVAKLSLGALAWGDVWFGGLTRNPWNPEQGSSGSSAGPASAVSAGLVAFAIGSETWGSIVSPSTRCGDTGLRPTFGRVSRTGAMALSWSMDKLGPICRTTEDCAMVFNVIRGKDGLDQTVIDAPFNYQPDIDYHRIRFGYLEKAFEQDTTNATFNYATLEVLRKLGADLIPIELPDLPVYDMSFILNAEAAAAFQELTLSGRDSLLVRQVRDAWPNVFRGANFIPAVEYIQANRARTLLIQKMAEIMSQVDVYVAPSFGEDLLLTNLSGHPCVVLPNGFTREGQPTSISFIGRLFDEATLLAVAKKYQDATGFQLKHPGAFLPK